jgi:hypothetical protein
MKVLLILVILLFVAGSFVADFLWRRWVAERRRGREPQ